MSNMSFHDLVNRLRNPGDEEISPTIYDDLTQAYDTAFDGYTANTSEKDAEIQRLNGEVSRLKSSNYDLLTQVSSSNDSVDEPEKEVDSTVTISSLFKRK